MPANPYPIAFKIADANFIPLDDVNAYLVICYVATAPTPVAPPCQSPEKIRRFKAAWRDHALTKGQSFTIAIDDFMRLPATTKFGGADISIIVEYRPWSIPMRQEKEFDSPPCRKAMGSYIGSRGRSTIDASRVGKCARTACGA